MKKFLKKIFGFKLYKNYKEVLVADNIVYGNFTTPLGNIFEIEKGSLKPRRF